MATWTDTTTMDTAPDAPVTSELMTALRDNPVALAGAVSNVPYIKTIWHPYNGEDPSDGFTGVIWDQSVDGNVSSIVSPTFENGWEYAFLFEGIGTNYVGGSSLQFEAYRVTSAAYTATLSIATMDNTEMPYSGGTVAILRPMQVQDGHSCIWEGALITTLGSTAKSIGDVTRYTGSAYGTPQAVSAVRISQNRAGSVFNQGKIYMLRRRVY